MTAELTRGFCSVGGLSPLRTYLGERQILHPQFPEETGQTQHPINYPPTKRTATLAVSNDMRASERRVNVDLCGVLG